MKCEECLIGVLACIGLFCILIIGMQVVNYIQLEEIKQEVQILGGYVIHD